MSGAMFSMPGDPMAAMQVAMEEQNRRVRRDMFAIHALSCATILHKDADSALSPSAAELARSAVRLADAMIAELERGGS